MPSFVHTIFQLSAFLLFCTGCALASAASEAVDCSAGGDSQLEMNICAGQEREAADAKLTRLVDELKGHLEPETFAELEQLQVAWAKVREQDCRFEQSFYDGGSIAPLVYTNCMTAWTQARIDGLKVYLCEGAGMAGYCEASRAYDEELPDPPSPDPPSPDQSPQQNQDPA